MYRWQDRNPYFDWIASSMMEGYQTPTLFVSIQSKVIGKLTAFVSSLTFLSGKWGGIFHDNRVLELSKGKFGLRMVKQFLVLIELKLSS